MKHKTLITISVEIEVDDNEPPSTLWSLEEELGLSEVSLVNQSIIITPPETVHVENPRLESPR